MPIIQCLDSHVADLIAAGEVVERPASVAKELLENALDAGASAISVEIQHGGLTYLRITDNGCGIAPSQLPTAFLRHATSKLRRAEDLAAIGTLGFRGEALAAIAAVSRVDIFSRERGADQGASLHLEGGVPGEVTETGCPEGTTLCVRDLFYNTPARMKFLKKDSSEGTFVADNVAHVALSHPEVSVKFIREGKLQYVTPGDGQLRSAAYEVLGREFSRDLIELKNQEGVSRITGLITPPKSCRASRSMQHFYINGRYVRNRTMMAGMEMAFKGTMMQGKFPGGILLLEMPADLVDVNVHPAKVEVRFARENDIFDVVYHAVKLALAQPGTGERLFTFDADEKVENEKTTDKKIENDVKHDNFTGLSAIIPGQADPGTLPQQRREPAKTEERPALRPEPVGKAAPTAVPRWQSGTQNAPMLDPFVTLHSPETESPRTAEPFRAAASEAQLDVEPALAGQENAKIHAAQDHMAAWNAAPAVQENKSAPSAPESPDGPAEKKRAAAACPAEELPAETAEPEQLDFAPPRCPISRKNPNSRSSWALMYRRGKNRCAMWAKFSAPIFWQSGETSCA